MIIIPDGAKKLLDNYVNVFDAKVKSEMNESYRRFYEDILNDLISLKEDLTLQRGRDFSGTNKEIMVNFVNHLNKYDEFMTFEERCKYFSTIRINPSDLKRIIEGESKDAITVKAYLFDLVSLWADGLDEIDCLNREFIIVETKDQIPSTAKKSANKSLESWEIYYDVIDINKQIPNEVKKSLSLKKNLLDSFKKWNGLYDIAVYYVLVK